MNDFNVATLCSSTLKKINECWLPHHFREVTKRARKALKPLQHLKAIVNRIDRVMALGANLDAHEMLLEIKDDLMGEIKLLQQKEDAQKHFVTHQKHLRILNGKKLDFESENIPGKSELISKFGDSITKEITLKVYDEAEKNKAETARRLGITVGRLVQRLISYGAYQ